MFDKDYAFKGTHAEKVKRLTSQFEGTNQLFARNLDVYLMAPVVGFLYQRKEKMNKDGKQTNILYNELSKIVNDLKFIYSLIMLLDTKHEPDLDERINKAFRYFGTEKAKEDEELFEDYVRGGIDVLYDKLIEGATLPEDYMNNLYDFLEEINERYNQKINKVDIKDIFACARE